MPLSAESEKSIKEIQNPTANSSFESWLTIRNIQMNVCNTRMKPNNNKAGCSTVWIIFPIAIYHHCDTRHLNIQCFQLFLKWWCSHKSRELLKDGECNLGYFLCAYICAHFLCAHGRHEKNLCIRKLKSHSLLWYDPVREEGGKIVLEVVQLN